MYAASRLTIFEKFAMRKRIIVVTIIYIHGVTVIAKIESMLEVDKVKAILRMNEYIIE